MPGSIYLLLGRRQCFPHIIAFSSFLIANLLTEHFNKI